MIDDEPELSIYDFNSIINYIKNNFIQILLLLFVFLIIYTIDKISNINKKIYFRLKINLQKNNFFRHLDNYILKMN